MSTVLRREQWQDRSNLIDYYVVFKEIFRLSLDLDIYLAQFPTNSMSTEQQNWIFHSTCVLWHRLFNKTQPFPNGLLSVGLYLLSRLVLPRETCDKLNYWGKSKLVHCTQFINSQGMYRDILPFLKSICFFSGYISKESSWFQLLTHHKE